MKQQHRASWSARATQLLLVVVAGGGLAPSGCGLASSPAPAERTGVVGDFVDSTTNWFGGGTLVATGRVQVGGELVFTDGRRECRAKLFGLEPEGGWGANAAPSRFRANVSVWCDLESPVHFPNALTPALLECPSLGLNVRITPDTFNGSEAEVEAFARPLQGVDRQAPAVELPRPVDPTATPPRVDYSNSGDQYWLLCTRLAEGKTCPRATHDCVASVAAEPWDPETYRCVPRTADGRCTWGSGMTFRECRTGSVPEAMGWQFCSNSGFWHPCELPPWGQCTLVNVASANWLNAAGVTAATGPAVLDAAAGSTGCYTDANGEPLE